MGCNWVKSETTYFSFSRFLYYNDFTHTHTTDRIRTEINPRLCAPTGTHTHTSHLFYKNGFSNNKRMNFVVYSTTPQCENCRTQRAHFPHQAPSNHIMSWRQMREMFHQRTTNACAQRPGRRNPPICSATDIPTWE